MPAYFAFSSDTAIRKDPLKGAALLPTLPNSLKNYRARAGGIRSLLRRERQPYDRSGESCCAVLAFSRVDLQEATSETGIRVAECCLVINQWRQLLWLRGDRQRSGITLWVT
jgi:hypothetical protein